MADEEKRKTVSVRSDLDRPISLHLHTTVADDGGGRPFQGRDLTTATTLNPGNNPGIDKEFFEKWQEQNKGSSLAPLFTATDEDKPESAERKE